MSRLVGILTLAALLGVGACDDGPGSWTATVEGPVAVGAALVEVRGEGITGFEGAGDSQVFPDPTPATRGVRRVVVVSPSGAVSFRITVEDAATAPPAITLVSAADLASQPLAALGGFSVRVAR